ncbi:MAG: HIT domain-containing protein [Ignavibacteria bacterium]|nr:HIT domain-containing protein [Ignavibacteria bacterium]
MEKLWSPWRSVYIDSFKTKDTAPACVFCEAQKESIEDDSSLVIHKGKLTFTVLNLYPYNNGHLMVVPYRHLNDFSQLTPEEHSEIMAELDKAIKALRLNYNPEGFNLGANLGKTAGAGIDSHLHFHIVPRWNGDTNFMPVLGEVKVISQDLLVCKKQLIEQYKKL